MRTDAVVKLLRDAEDVATPTRTVFQGMDPVWHYVFYTLAFVSTAVFMVGLLLLLRRYRFARAGGRRIRAGRMIAVVLSHTWISRRSGVVGWAHAGVFYGFLVLLAGTTILAIQDHIARPLGFDFWRDGFYEGYSLFLDVFGAAMLVGLVVLAVRRLTATGPRLDYARVDGRIVSSARSRYSIDDWVFLWSLMIIGASGFLLEAFRIAIDQPSFEVWSPVGYWTGSAFRSLGMSPDTADGLRLWTWWFHALIALVFVAAIPFTKAMHMLTGPSAVAVREPDVGRRLPSDPETGYASLADFMPAHRLDLDACTKCGKCHEACPARASAMPLSPRDLILDLREAQGSGFTGALVPDVIAAETIWSCMQCNACVDVCPVGIEHVPIINLLRRAQVEAGEMDALLQSTLASVRKTGNSFGEPKRKRANWVKELDFELPDARIESVEVLWYVGDYASLDPRNQRNTRALATILKAAGVNVGILHEAEKTAGNDVRRAGEEGLFRSLAADNMKLVEGCEFATILTSDPHSFNTLRNEYPRLGATWTPEQVTHHSVFLLNLIQQGRLVVTAPLGRRATYHDPCALGRYNGIFDEPRDLIRCLGVDLIEMPRNKSNSFCCGAGGGRIWMKETAPAGSRRPSEDRIDEAVALGSLDYFVVACPKDTTMYEDAIKTSGHAGHIQLREISELVLEATGLGVGDSAEPQTV